MNENRNTKNPKKLSPFAWMADKKKRTWFIGGVSLVLAAVILLIVLLGGGTTDTDSTASAEERDPRKYETIRNGDFGYTLLEDEDNKLYTYPLAPDGWTADVKVGYALDDEGMETSQPDNLAGQNARFGIITTNTDSDKGKTFAALTSEEIGYLTQNPAKPLGTPDDEDNILSGNRVTDPHDNILMLFAGETTKSGINYKSSSFYINAGEYAEISIWIKTVDVDRSDNAQIRVQTNEADELFFANIVTEGVTGTNNGWVEYKFYVSTNLTYGQSLTLNLSLGYEKDGETVNYADGYAFFSDINLRYINQKEYNEAIDENNPSADFIKYHNFRTETGAKEIEYRNGKFDDTNATSNGTLVGTPAPHAVAGVNTNSDIVDLDTATYDGGQPLDNHPFANVSNALMIHNEGYTSFGYTFMMDSSVPTSQLLVGINRYYKVSVWVKTSEMVSGRGAAIYLVNDRYNSNREKYPSVWFEGIDTTKVSQTGKEYNDGWVEYSFYIQGSGADVHRFHLELWLGNRGLAGATASDADRAMGYALFANVTISAITLSEYQNVSSGTTAKTLSLPTKTASGAVSNGSFDTPTNNDLYSYPLNPSSWTLFYSGHNALNYLDDDQRFATQNDEENNDLPRKTGDHSAGIINTSVSLADILGTIVDSDPARQQAKRDAKKADLKAAIGDGWGNGDDFWDNMRADANPGVTGPNVLMLANHASSAFGYRSSSISLSANSYYRISVRVRTFNIVGEGVNIYLTGLDAFDSEGEIIDDATLTNENARFLGIDSANLSGNHYANNVFEMSGTSTVAAGWTEYSILVVTGEKTKTVNLELWLGGREYDVNNRTSGYAFFDNVKVETYQVDDEKNKNNHDYVNRFAEILEKLENGGMTLPVGQEEFVYEDYNTFYSNLMILDYSMEVEEEEEVDRSVEEEEKEPAEFDWLLIPSIIIALVLLLAVASVFYRKLTKNIRRSKKMKPSSDYKRKMPASSKVSDDIDNDETEQQPQKPAPKEKHADTPATNKKTDEDSDL